MISQSEYEQCSAPMSIDGTDRELKWAATERRLRLLVLPVLS